jgi:hypothetical protein
VFERNQRRGARTRREVRARGIGAKVGVMSSVV